MVESLYQSSPAARPPGITVPCMSCSTHCAWLVEYIETLGRPANIVTVHIPRGILNGPSADVQTPTADPELRLTLISCCTNKHQQLIQDHVLGRSAAVTVNYYSVPYFTLQ